MTIDEARAHIGGGVIHHGDTDRAEDGVITFVTDRSVFVRYKGGMASYAADPADLTLLAATDADVTERRRQWRASLRGDAD